MILLLSNIETHPLYFEVRNGTAYFLDFLEKEDDKTICKGR